MSDIQSVVQSMLDLITQGGVDAVKSLAKDAVLGAGDRFSKAWRVMFDVAPDTEPLARRLAEDPHDQATREKLDGLLRETLAANPDLLNKVEVLVVGDIKADNGSVAAGVIKAPITINN